VNGLEGRKAVLRRRNPGFRYTIRLKREGGGNAF